MMPIMETVPAFRPASLQPELGEGGLAGFVTHFVGPVPKSVWLERLGHAVSRRHAGVGRQGFVRDAWPGDSGMLDRMVGWLGIEPRTSGLKVRCSTD